MIAIRARLFGLAMRVALLVLVPIALGAVPLDRTPAPSARLAYAVIL